VTLADLSKRTGWTFSEIDEQDSSVVMPALLGQNVRDALRRVQAYVETQGKTGIATSDMTVWGEIVKLMDEEPHPDSPPLGEEQVS
jgi:hypothetical protein